jgi:hypothetical protein
VRRSGDGPYPENRGIPDMGAFAGSNGHAVGPLSVEEDGEVTAAHGRG